MVTVTVPSPFGSITNGPASVVVIDFPLAGFVYVTWKLTAWVTSRPSENTVSRRIPSVWKVNGNGQVFGPAGIVPVRSRCVSLTTGLSAAAAGTNATSAVAATAAARAKAFITSLPSSSAS